MHLQMYPTVGDTAAQGQVRFVQPVLKDIPPQFFIFKSGAGPYELVEKEFGPLKEFMAANRIEGQLAAVFYDDPEKVPAESLRWEAGVITIQRVPDAEPYSEKIISGRKAVSWTAPGAAPGQNHAHYSKMQGFIRQRRLIFRPPAMEVWLSPGQEGARTEILLPVVQKRRGP
jgi:DNA gyrase inhibitor GyrI